MFLSSKVVTSVAYSPCGGRIVSASMDCTIKVWEASTGTCQSTLRGHSKDNPECTCSHGRGRPWEYKHNPECPVTVDAGVDGVQSVCFSPEDNVIAAGCGNGNIYLVDAQAGEVKSSLSGHDDYVLSVCFSPDGKQITSGSRDETIKIWNASTGKLQSTLSGHDHWVESVCFSPDGKKIASGARDKTVRIWDAATGAAVGSPLSGVLDVRSVAFSPDKRRIAAGCGGNGRGKILIFKLQESGDWERQSECPLTVDAGAWGVQSVCFSPTDNVIAAGCGNGNIYLVDAQAVEVKSSLSGGHDDIVWSVCFSPDGKKIASGAEDETVRIWDAATGAAVGSPLRGHRYVPFPCIECLLL